MPESLPLAAPHTDEWYRLRKTMVTASNSCHLMLRDTLRWAMSDEELAERMLRGTFEPNERMAAGSHYEAANMGWLSHITGLTVEPDGRLWGGRQEHMGASPDCWLHEREARLPSVFEPTFLLVDEWGTTVTGYDAVQTLRDLVSEIAPYRLLTEMKQAETRVRSKHNKTEPPPHQFCQVQHQMHVLGLTKALLVCKVGAFEMYAHVIAYDPAFCAELDAKCKAFYEEYL